MSDDLTKGAASFFEPEHCDVCGAFPNHKAIRLPVDLFLIRDLLIARRAHLDIKTEPNGKSELNVLLEGKYHPDSIDCFVTCLSCAARFHLFGEFYHGRGGEFLKL